MTRVYAGVRLLALALLLLCFGRSASAEENKGKHAAPVATEHAAVPTAPKVAPTDAVQQAAVPKPESDKSSWERASASERLSHIDQEQEQDTDRVSVQLVANEPGIVFYSWVGPGLVQNDRETAMLDGQAYQKLCEAPCVTGLRPGHNRFALSYHGADPILVPQEVTLYQPTTFRAEYQSYGLRRILGGAILTAGGAGAVALLVTAPDCKKDPSDLSKPLACNYTQKWIGLALGAASAALGITLLLKSDVADVGIVPGLTPPATPTRGEAARSDGFAYDLRGLSLFGRF